MPAALGHLGRCLPSIGLRFTHARRNAAPRTVPHGPRPDGAGPTAAPIARTPARHAHGTPAAHPIAAAGACRGCCPAAVTLCANRAALARAWIYKFLISYKLCCQQLAKPRPVVKVEPRPPVRRVFFVVACVIVAPASAVSAARCVGWYGCAAGNRIAANAGRIERERRNAGTVFAFLAWVRIYCPQPPDKANALPVGWSIKTAFPFLVCVFDRPPQQ